MPSTPALTDIPSSAEDTDALSFMASNSVFLSSDDAATGLHNLLKTPLSAELHWFILKKVPRGASSVLNVLTPILPVPNTAAK